MNWDPCEHWTKALGRSLVKSIRVEIGGQTVDRIDNLDSDSYSHTGLILDPKTKLIYELADY